MLYGRNLRVLSIVLVVIVAVAGVVAFVLAYNYYPRKGVNVQFEGQCYELLGSAFDRYQKLAAEREIESLRMFMQKIEDPDAKIKITLVGKVEEVTSLSKLYNIDVVKERDFSSLNKIEIEGYIMKRNLDRIADIITIDDKLGNTALGSIAILSSEYLNEKERTDIATKLDAKMNRGIENIITDNRDVRKAECR